jgi:hypothetical protein
MASCYPRITSAFIFIVIPFWGILAVTVMSHPGVQALAVIGLMTSSTWQPYASTLFLMYVRIFMNHLANSPPCLLRLLNEYQVIYLILKYLGCAFLQESPEFPGIRRNLGSKKKELRFFIAGTSRKSRSDRKGTLKNMFLFCQNIKIRPSRDL